MRFSRTRKLIAAFMTLAMILGMLPAFAAEQKADTVYRNGNIYAVDEAFTTASALAIVGSKLVYVGDESGVDAFVGPNTRVVDLGGKTVIPGLIESHMHVDKYGFRLLAIDIYAKPKDVILKVVAEAVAQAEPGEWISASGWNETYWADPVYPTKEDLDAVAPNNPVLLGRSDGHMAWANSKAFEATGITKDTPNPQGGEFLKNPDGTLQGCMTDTAWSQLSAAIPAEKTTPEQDEAELKEAMMASQASLFSMGITSAMDAGVSVERIESYKKLFESGDLKLRMYPLLRLTEPDGEMAEYLKKNPASTEELYDNHLLVRGVKLFSDGALGSRGAWFLEDYSDRSGYVGEFRNTDEQMDALVKLAYDQGYQPATHAIGDAAVRQVLNAYEKAMTANPKEDPRMRVEHFQVVDPADMDRALKLGIIPSMQFTHAITDMLMAEDRVGSERIKGAYAWRTVLDKGGIIASGTDAPFDRINPFHCMYAGVTRIGLNGLPEGGWYPEQCITREEALRSYTCWGAYAQFEEDLKGSLEVGKLADFAVLDRDYMTCPAADIKDIQVLTTVSGGEVVHTMDTSAPAVLWQGEALDFYSKLRFDPAGTIYVPVNDVVSGLTATKEMVGEKVKVTYEKKSVELPVTDVDGVSCVAVRALFEGLGYTVTWYPLSQTVSVSR